MSLLPETARVLPPDPRPALINDGGPIGRFRRWYRQFYS